LNFLLEKKIAIGNLLPAVFVPVLFAVFQSIWPF